MYFGGIPAPKGSKGSNGKSSDLLDACFDVESKFFDNFGKNKIETCSSCCPVQIRRGLYSEGSGYAEYDLSPFKSDRRVRAFSQMRVRFSFLLASSEGTIFSFGPIRLYAQNGHLRLKLGDDYDEFLEAKRTCSNFPEKACDGKPHQVVVSMCFSPKCPRRKYAGVSNYHK